MSDYKTCRFCGEGGFDGMVKYGVRHHAHYRCFLEAKGANGYLGLHDWQMVDFPYNLLVEFGLTSDAYAASDRINNGTDK
jgi:hypothetical protein